MRITKAVAARIERRGAAERLEELVDLVPQGMCGTPVIGHVGGVSASGFTSWIRLYLPLTEARDGFGLARITHLAGLLLGLRVDDRGMRIAGVGSDPLWTVTRDLWTIRRKYLTTPEATVELVGEEPLAPCLAGAPPARVGGFILHRMD